MLQRFGCMFFLFNLLGDKTLKKSKVGKQNMSRDQFRRIISAHVIPWLRGRFSLYKPTWCRNNK